MKIRDEPNKELEDAVSCSSNNVVQAIFQKSNIKAAKALRANSRKEMSQLMTELESCEVHFVRCIKQTNLRNGTSSSGTICSSRSNTCTYLIPSM
jgi:myosin heavy subunit